MAGTEVQGDGGVEGGRELYLKLHCHHQNDFCVEMGSDESHVNLSVTACGKVTIESVHEPELLKRKESRSGESNRGALTTLRPKRLYR